MRLITVDSLQLLANTNMQAILANTHAGAASSIRLDNVFLIFKARVVKYCLSIHQGNTWPWCHNSARIGRGTAAQTSLALS